MAEELKWEPLDYRTPTILCLRLGTDEIARVSERVYA